MRKITVSSRGVGLVGGLAVLCSVLTTGCVWVYAFVAFLFSLYIPWTKTDRTTVPGVSFFGDDGSGPAAAAVKMWWEYYGGGSGSEGDIANYLSGIGASGGGYPGVSPDQFAAALQNYTGRGVRQYYDGVCNGGRSCADQALADIHIALYNNRPPATIWGDYAIIKGDGVSYDCTAADGCQPSSEFLILNVPVSGYGENYSVTTGFFLDVLIGEVAPRNVFYGDSADPMTVADDGWADWAAYHGTYYGDPNPPGPTCPYFADYCGGDSGGGPPPPFLVTNGGGTSEPGPRFWKANHVAVPNPKTRDGIIADFVAGLEQTRINLRPGMAPLMLQDGTVQVREIVKVRSLVPSVLDYYVLYFVDRSTHALYARAAVSSRGLLMSVSLSGGEITDRTVATAADAKRVLVSHGFSSNVAPEPVFDLGPGSLPELDPSFMGTDANGRKAIVTARGGVRF